MERHQDVMERKAGCSALAAVLAFTEAMADSGGHGKWSLGLYDAHRFMRLVRVWLILCFFSVFGFVVPGTVCAVSCFMHLGRS